MRTTKLIKILAAITIYVKRGNFGNDDGNDKEKVSLENQHLRSCDYFAILPATQNSTMKLARYDTTGVVCTPLN